MPGRAPPCAMFSSLQSGLLGSSDNSGDSIPVSSSALLSAAEVAVPPVPVARPLMPSAEAILPYLQRIDAKRWYSNFGPLLIELEARLAARFTRPTLVCTAVNGTQALTLALQALRAK